MLKKKFISGFTLQELLVVMGILILLMALGVIAYRAQVSKGYDARRKTDIYQVRVAVEEYEKDHDCYPATIGACGPGETTLLSPYIEYVPCDPETPNPTYTYFAEPDSCPSWYWILAELDNESDPDIADVGCEDGCGINTDPDTWDYNFYLSSDNAPKPANAFAETGESSYSYYGCFSGSCTQITYDPDRPGPACDPNFTTSNCADMCRDVDGNSINECDPWE